MDDTGGFGAGWIDGLRRLGRSPICVGFGAKPNDGRYFNKRAEMAFECVQWIRRGGALPESANLLTALTQTTYTFQGDKLLLEPKADLKDRIGFSPHEFDAFILTFALPVMVPDFRPRYRMAAEYNPYAEEGATRPPNFNYEYNPAGRLIPRPSAGQTGGIDRFCSLMGHMWTAPWQAFLFQR